MDCKFYTSCQKEHSCPFLGECVFGHKLIIERNSPQSKIQLHYGKTTKSVANVLRKVRRGKQFIGDESPDANKHLKNIEQLVYKKNVDDVVKNLLSAPEENFHYL